MKKNKSKKINSLIKIILFIMLLPFLMYAWIFKKEDWSFKSKALASGALTLVFLVIYIVVPKTDYAAENKYEESTTASIVEALEEPIEEPIEEPLVDASSKNSENDNTLELTKNEASNEVSEITEAESSSVIKEVEATSTLYVHFLNVGQALSVLVSDDNGNDLLYDAGNSSDANFIVSYLKKQGVDDIEYLINSHPHEDHIGGMDEILNEFEVENVIMSNLVYDTNAYTNVINILTDKNIAVTDPIVGQTYQLGTAVIEVLGPLNTSYTEANGYSVVIRVSSGSQSVLLTGDAEAESEHELVASRNDLSADILQIGHHGSAYSSTIQFVSKVNPKYAVISVGTDNSYGHPDSIVTMRLANMNINVERTDMNGTIVFELNGKDEILVQELNTGNPDTAEKTVDNEDDIIVSTVTSEEIKPAETVVPIVPEEEIGRPIKISNVNKTEEFVSITNSGSEPKDIGGWTLISEKGADQGQTYTFKSGFILNAGESITLIAGKNPVAGEGEIIMATKNIWNNSEPDAAILLNELKEEVDRR